MTQTMLMVEWNLSREQVQKAMKKLQEKGVLVREESNQSGKWIVKKID